MSLALIRSGKLICVYCGCTATTADHVPAIIYKNFVEVHERYCVPACRECNLVLGRKKLFDALDRRIWIQGYYRKKYRRILRLPEIPFHELEYNLRQFVRGGLHAKRWITNRISYTPAPKDDLKFPYYQDGRLAQDRSSFLEAARGLPEAIREDFQTEVESLIQNDPWINGFVKEEEAWYG